MEKRLIDPTMKRSTEEKLNHLYNKLEEEWDSIKQSKLRVLHRRSTDSSIMVKALPLLYNSPRSLMSSLQQRRSPSDEVAWKVRNNDLAVIEILIERRAAIESGKLKGRRLFEEVEGVSEVGLGRRDEICSDWNDLMTQDCEVRSVSSYDSDDQEGIGGNDEEFPVCCSYSSSGSTSVNGEVVGGEVKEGEGKRGVSGGRWLIGLGWLLVALIVGVVGITSLKRFVGYIDEDEVILVPT